MPSIISAPSTIEHADGDRQLGARQPERHARRRTHADIDSTISADATSSAVPMPICTCRRVKPTDHAGAQERAEHRGADDADERQEVDFDDGHEDHAPAPPSAST